MSAVVTTRVRECPVPVGTPFRALHTCWASVDEDDQGPVVREPTKHWTEFYVEDVRPVSGTTQWELVTTRCDGTPLRVRVTATGRPAGMSLGRLFVGKPHRENAPPRTLLTPTSAALPPAVTPLAYVAYPQASFARGIGRTWVTRCQHCPWEYTATRKTDVELERDQHLHAHRSAPRSQR